MWFVPKVAILPSNVELTIVKFPYVNIAPPSRASFFIKADSSIVPVPNYKIIKVILLALIDRTKCNLVPEVLKYGGAYSMGAVAGCFQCQVCMGVLGPGVQRTCTCYHTDYTDLSSYGKIYNGKLHYITALDPIFGECSVLSSSPADVSAVGDIIFMPQK